ncbi:hypothetical protein DE146DRAFT_639173 [Phaeosphaeria sp. MPI-PUGE-AT-0046c]|nr:hypothetical protein DE146DRAFT_639173 [Phaeosphaeria sp. MPI-PUGE-AT-0046c]
MGAVEDAVDGAAEFIGPFTKQITTTQSPPGHEDGAETDRFVLQALSHLQIINSADLTTDPNAPYDASLAGVVYGLLDAITFYGILPRLSPGVAFSQRPRSVLSNGTLVIADRDTSQLKGVVNVLVRILEQKGSGIQPLLSQRILPDIISALAELSFSPSYLGQNQEFAPVYAQVMGDIPTSRLLPILTTFLQQPLPIWLKPVLMRQLAMVPSRPRGIRHTIEFLSLSYLAKVSQLPQNPPESQSELPIPMEAVTEATRVIVLPPAGIDRDEWLHQLAPQLWSLLDGEDGPELSRAAGQIIAQGILSKRSTGAPGTIGWKLFAMPIHDTIHPKGEKSRSPRQRNGSDVLVQEQDLETALKRLLAILSSYFQPGVVRRLMNPVLLSIWELLNYAQERPALNKKWALLSRGIILRYMSIACDANQVDTIATNLFWDAHAGWTFMPGSQGGIEIRSRREDDRSAVSTNNILVRLASLDTRVTTLVNLLADAKVSDTILGSVFVQVTKRWLSLETNTNPSLTDEVDSDPFTMLIDAKLSETMARRFRDNFARNPHHVIELMGQLLTNFTSNHKIKVQKVNQRSKVTRGNLLNIATTKEKIATGMEDDTADEQLATFAISIISTLITSSSFEQTTTTRVVLEAVIESLEYLRKAHSQHPLSIAIRNSATNLLHALRPVVISTHGTEVDAAAEHRSELKTVLTSLTSPEPPDRTWALNSLRQFLRNQDFFDVVDVPSTTHLLLSASLADPESYVHIAAIPVMTDLALRAASPVINILVDAFIDADERSLKAGQARRPEDNELDIHQVVDFRLRVGEVLNNFVLAQDISQSISEAVKHECLKQISEACLSVASRRGQRTQTQSERRQRHHAEQSIQEEAEAAWGGPIPNLLDPEGENPQDQADRDALLKIVQGWEDTGLEEDVRVRASALSVLSTIVEHQLTLLRQATVDAALQMVSLILTMETTESKAILRRAAVMVFMGLLRGLDDIVGSSVEKVVGLDMVQQSEITRVLKWVATEDNDNLVRDHATSVLEDLETWRMKKLYQVREEGLVKGMRPELGLEGRLRGLDVQPQSSTKNTDGGRKLIVEEID